jgi:hypothetical protein
MGLNLGRGTGAAWGDVSPSITPREYVSALAAATDLLRDPGCCVEAAAHRLLGLGHLAGGRVGPAVKHLEIALGLARRDARGALGMTETLRLQCEAARLRLVLMGLYMRLGDVHRASVLAREIQAGF